MGVAWRMLRVAMTAAMIQGLPLPFFICGIAALFAVSVVGFAAAGTRRAPVGGSRTFDVLRVPVVGALLRWRPFRFILQVVFAGVFLLIIAAGLFGDQQPGSNAATVFTWTYWWILLTLFAMFLGKAWCYVCPWDAVSGWLQRLSPWGRPRWALSANLRWPKVLRNLYPAAALFVGLTWLELGYGVTTRPAVTALLALLMFFLAFVPALVFERSSFCRYGCLVGRISGLYSLFAPIELRARDRHVCATVCDTRDCFHGNERGNPCPTFQYLGGMTKNTYCILCTECLFTCPHGNVAINLRPFGADVVKPAPVRADEAAMVVIMLSMSVFHGITMTPVWHASIAAIEHGLRVPYLAAFTIGMIAFLLLLAGLYFLFIAGSAVTSRAHRVGFRQLAIRYAYAFLPIALFYHLSHNAMHFIVEGGAIAPVLSNPFGWNWNLFGTAHVVPGPLLPAGAMWAIIVGALLAGQLWSVMIGRRIAMQLFPNSSDANRSAVPILGGMVAYSILSLWIALQPMTMRTSL
jgi:hypothetical protein